MKNENYKDIKTFDDALKATGRPDVPMFADVPEDMREYFQAQYKASVITEAINGSWKADWTDKSQWKYIPWFSVDKNSPSGFAFGGAGCGDSYAAAGYASRLCFETREQAEYAGRIFTDIFVAIVIK